MTTVGFVIRNSRISAPASISMVSDLPDPCVCQTTPPRPSPSPRRLQTFEHARSRLADRAELVVARDLLGDLSALVLHEDDACSQIIDQCLWIEQPPDHCFQRRRAAFGGPPRHEPAAGAGDGTDAGQHSVRHDQRQIRHEQVRRRLLVAIELFDGDAEVRLGVGWVFEFEQRNRQAVQEDRQVRTDELPRRAGDGELADRPRTSFSSGFSKLTRCARPPRVSPVAASRYSTSTPSVSWAWNQRLFWMSVGCGGCATTRTTSSIASCGRHGLSRCSGGCEAALQDASCPCRPAPPHRRSPRRASSIHPRYRNIQRRYLRRGARWAGTSSFGLILPLFIPRQRCPLHHARQ